MKSKNEEEMKERLLAYLSGETFEYILDYFMEGNSTTNEPKSFQKVEVVLAVRSGI